MDLAACSFNVNVSFEDNSLCVYASDFYPSGLYDCDGNCLLDSDNDGICDALENYGCLDEAACNYDPTATELGAGTFTENFDGLFAPQAFNNQTVPTNDYFTSGYLSLTSGTWEVLDMDTFFFATSSPPNALTWNTNFTSGYATLTFIEPANDVSFTMSFSSIHPPDSFYVQVNSFGGTSSSVWLGAVESNNYFVLSQTDVTSLTFLFNASLGCLDDITFTIEEDCDFESCLGCLDPLACNFNPSATSDISPSLCEYTSCVGCTDTLACNFNPSATLDALPSLCEYNSCAGCTDQLACNVDFDAIISDSSQCVYAGCNWPDCSLGCVIPDIEGSCFYWEMEMSGFEEGQTLDSIQQLDSVFVNMEHSYLIGFDNSFCAPMAKASWCTAKEGPIHSSAFPWTTILILTQVWVLITRGLRMRTMEHEANAGGTLPPGTYERSAVCQFRMVVR